MKWKKKKDNASFKALMQDKVAAKIGAGIQRVQSLWAEWMGRQASKLSPFGLKLVMGIYFAVMASVSFYYILMVFQGGTRDRPEIVQGAISLPSLDHSDPTIAKSKAVPAELFNRIQSFKNTMDSLSGTAEGIRIKDSLLAGRPHLLDSMSEIERIYLMQQ